MQVLNTSLRNILKNTYKIRNLTSYNKAQLEKLINEDKAVLFIKGTETEPMCGFSLSTIRVMQLHTNNGVKYYNILQDDKLRQAMKDFSRWPTFPQVYIGGKFVGGCDLLIQMHKSGELIELLKNAGIKSLLEEHFKKD